MVKSSGPIKFPLILLAVLIVISGIFLTFSTGSFVLDFKQIGFSVLSTAQKGISTAVYTVENAFQSISELSTLREQYHLLNEELKNYEYLQRSNVQIRQENDRLNELLGLTQTYDYETSVARIIGRDPQALYSGITVDKGSMNGVKKNMPVIAIQNGNVGLVGKVVTVGLYTSFIMPIYDYSSHVSARIQKTRDIGIVTGNGSADNPLLLQYINERVIDELQYGDVIVTSGENDNYMRETVIGTISSVSVVEYDSSLIISVTPIIDFSRLEEVIMVDFQSSNETTGVMP
ncbi:MAG: rod shape-determining protein MreC [Spirochaetales bacterium]